MTSSERPFRDPPRCLAAGVYPAVLIEVAERKSKKNLPMLVLNFEVQGGVRRRRVRGFIVNPTSLFMLKELACSLDQEGLYEAGRFQPSEFLGCEVLLDLRVLDTAAYGKQNNIASYKRANPGHPIRRIPVTPQGSVPLNAAWRNEHCRLLQIPFAIRCTLSDFTLDELWMLHKCGTWLHALATGSLPPQTAQQRSFADAASCKAPPATAIEHLWAMYAKVHDSTPPACAGGIEADAGQHTDGLTDDSVDDYALDGDEESVSESRRQELLDAEIRSRKKLMDERYPFWPTREDCLHSDALTAAKAQGAWIHEQLQRIGGFMNIGCTAGEGSSHSEDSSAVGSHFFHDGLDDDDDWRDGDYDWEEEVALYDYSDEAESLMAASEDGVWPDEEEGPAGTEFDSEDSP